MMRPVCLLLFLVLSSSVHAQVCTARIEGEFGATQFGVWLKRTSDLTGDGVDDLVVGRFWQFRIVSGATLTPMPQFRPGTTFNPSMDHDLDGIDDYYSGTSGGIALYSGLTGQVLWSLPTAPLTNFGVNMAGGRDVDADGVPDFIVAGSTGGFLSDGLARVYSGANQALLYEHIGSSYVEVYTGIAMLEDVNADGHDEYAIGIGGQIGSLLERVDVFSGADGCVLYSLHNGPNTDPNSYFDFFGLSISGLSDVNGDGRPDIAVGAERDDDMGLNAGSVSVFSGIDGALLYRVHGGADLDKFGSRVTDGGDLNGDGVSELLVTSRLGVNYDGGSVDCFSGDDGTVLFSLESDDVDFGYGDGLAGLGDFDGDGANDFVVGSPYWSIPHNSPVDLQVGEVTFYTGIDANPGNYCTAAFNSTGRSARIGHSGSARVPENDLVLSVRDGVPNEFGLFYYGPVKTLLPFGDGFRCVTGGVGEVLRIHPAVLMDATGSAQRPLDYQASPMDSGIGAIDVGSAYNFQFWYRDPAGPAGFNLTDGLSVVFCP
jgi:hypothetical protein